ncbi:IS630 family transposase [Streptomyces sp. NPDC018019]|uniref:IS630 family transposase n=1 Tax=Streptomyces sp. NPDC018019 TaxID=3365030 RepID=UPI0037B41CD7
MVLLALHGLSPAQIAAVLEYDPATVRRWIGRFNALGVEGLADRPRSGRPPLGGRRLSARIATLLRQVGPWAVPRLFRCLGRPQLSRRTLYRRVRQVAIWRRPKLIARGAPKRAAVLKAMVRGLQCLPYGARVWAADETHVHLLPHTRVSWTLPARRPQILPPGQEPTGHRARRAGGHDGHLGLPARPPQRGRLLALLQQLLAAFPDAPATAVLLDNDQIHHARAVRDFVAAHPGLHLWFAVRYSPHDNPTERIWAALKTFIANTAVSWPGRRRQIHAFFRTRSPGQLQTTAAPWTSPWFPTSYRHNVWIAA